MMLAENDPRMVRIKTACRSLSLNVEQALSCLLWAREFLSRIWIKRRSDFAHGIDDEDIIVHVGRPRKPWRRTSRRLRLMKDAMSVLN